MDIENIDKITKNIVFDIIFEQIAASKLALEQDDEESLTPEEEADANKVSDELRNTNFPEELADEAEEAVKLAYAANVLNKDQADQVVQNFAKNPYKATKKLMNTLKDTSFVDLYRKNKSRTKATDNYLNMLQKQAKGMSDKIGTDLKTAKIFKGPKNLSSQLKQAFPDLPPEALKGMLDDITAQLKANDMLVKEAILEGLLEEKFSVKHRKQFDDAKAAGEPIALNTAKGQWTGQNKDGIKKTFAQKRGEPNTDKAKRRARQFANKQTKAADPESEALWKEFRDMLKRLDLDTLAGRTGAKEDDQAFVGAYRYYAAMKMVRNALRRGKELPVDNIKKWLTPLNEGEREEARRRRQMERDQSPEPKSDETFSDWIDRMMKTFERQSLGGREAQRRYAKVKGFRSGRDQKDAETERSIKVQKGVVNINQSVGSRLKAAGVNPRTMRGKAMTNKITQLIAKFLDGSLKRAGKNKDTKNPDVDIIAKAVAESKMIRTIAENVFDELEECEIII
jgi:hypothetical protein